MKLTTWTKENVELNSTINIRLYDKEIKQYNDRYMKDMEQLCTTLDGWLNSITRLTQMQSDILNRTIKDDMNSNSQNNSNEKMPITNQMNIEGKSIDYSNRNMEPTSKTNYNK